ncbi:Fc.00g094750.m01.CDS01 [Cosmosporella sp. VM-42]
MSTPSFRYGELRAGLPSIKTAISTLRAMPLRLSADSSCGLHVHVGIDDGMTLLTAKKTVALVMVLEDHLLFPLCARSRQWNPSTAAISSRSHAAAGRHYPPVEAVGPGRLQPIADYLPQWTILAPAGWNHNKPRDIWHTLERVWTARSLQDLSVKLCFERYTRAGLAIALRDAFGKSQAHIHRGSLENTPSTIEFRYAQMSFDMQFIQNWIELVSRIVEIAQLEANEYQQCFNAILNELRDANMESEEPAWQRLMENVLELEHQVPAWKLQLAMYGQGKEIAHLSDDLILERDLDAH